MDKIIYQDEKEVKALSGKIIKENTNWIVLQHQHSNKTISINISRIIKIEKEGVSE